MKTYNTTLELLDAVKAGECPVYPFIDIYRIIAGDLEIDKIPLEDAAELFAREEDQLDYWVGGPINICETEEDLKQIQGYDFEWVWHNKTTLS